MGGRQTLLLISVVSVVCEQVFRVSQVVPVHQVDAIDALAPHIALDTGALFLCVLVHFFFLLAYMIVCLVLFCLVLFWLLNALVR